MVSGVVYTFERTYFDVRVLDPHALSNRHANLHSVYRGHKQIKKSAYEQRIREVEHATFLPLLPEAWPGRPTPFTPSPVYAPPSRPSEVQDSREDMPSKCQWWSTELIPNHIFTSGKGVQLSRRISTVLVHPHEARNACVQNDKNRVPRNPRNPCIRHCSKLLFRLYIPANILTALNCIHYCVSSPVKKVSGFKASSLHAACSRA